jgi:RHS repeat-associated protein
MQIDTALGVITWTPNSGQIGPTVVSIQVRDAVGNFSSQTFSVVVSAGAVNRPPVTASTPSIDAVVGQSYVYTMIANDPEGGTLTYAVRSAPSGFSIDPNTGIVTWTPSASHIGTVAIVLTATDPLGGVAVQSVQIDVRAANRLPVVRSNPVLKVSQGAVYQYDVLATDPDREPLYYSLLTAPAGMTIDPLGRIRWQTKLDTPLGGRDVVVRVVDGLGGAVTHSFTFGVVPDTLAPRITIIVGGEPVLYPWTTGPAVVRVIAADDVGLTSVELRVDGKPVELAPDGTARVYFSAPGNGRLEARAFDAAGNVGTALGRVSMRSGEEDGGGNPAPEATITSVSDGAAVGGFVNIVGTAAAPDFARYVLSYRRIDDSSYKTILNATTQVTAGSLGKWDTTLLENDNYVLNLEVYDTFGSFAAVEVEVSVSSNLKLGNFRLSFEDMTIPVAGIPITIARTYDTLRADRDGDFGFGWRMEYRNTDLRTSLPKSGLEDIGSYTPFKTGTKVFLTMPGGKREGFTFTPDIKVLPGFGRNNNLVLASPRFTPDRGVTSTLNAGSGQLTANEFGELYASGGIPWNPASPDFGGGYTLTTREGIQYRINGETGLMTSAVDRNGNVLSFSNEGVTSQSESLRIAMERDSRGRIRSITDPLGKKISYAYSASGDLTSVTDREGHLAKLSYRSDHAHYLDAIVDPLGRTGIRNEYDASGRLLGIINADGNRIQTTYDSANQLETIIDPLGNRTVNEYDSQGNVVSVTNAIGAVTRKEYDTHNFLTKSIDPLGRVTTMDNDAFGFKIAETDPRGNTTRWTYGRSGDETSKTDALGHVTRTDYDANGNLISRSDANGRSGSIQYSNKGLVQSLVAVDGVLMSVTNNRGKPDTFTTEGRRPIDVEYDAAGRPVAMRFQGSASNPETEVVIRLELDANGKTIRETDGEGGVTQSFYDDARNRIRMVDPIGRITRYEYDFANRLVKTIFPDITEESQSFDAAGRRVSMTDRLGRITRYEFDAAGKEIAVLYPDGTPNDLTDNPRMRTEFDLAGQVVKRIDELGHATTYQYDAAGNQVAMTNALNETWSMQYDANNRRLVDRDPLGNTTRTVYDGVGNMVQQLLPDGSQVLAEYDGHGRITSRVDGEGGRTMFRYDAYGALVEVVDPLGNRTRYERNERGQATAIIDAEGRTTEFQFDKANRQIARKLPDGAIDRSIYDAAGQLTSMVDFMGRTTTYTYDINGRLLRQQFSDGRINETQYNAIGQVVSRHEGATTTTYTFDERNRLTSKTDPDGLTIQYVYDVASNLLSTASIAGATVYSYDAVNRLQSVTAGSEVTRYVYDAAGRHTEIQYSNGTVERREYDLNSRVIRQTLTGPSGTLDDTRTAYDRVGRKTFLIEATGRKESVEYDIAGRLIRNSVDEVNGADRNTTWLYDAVGNRLRRDDSISGVTTYDYDNRDRLLSETNALTTRYLYDANGNILSQFDGVKRIENTWDAANRLMESNVTEGTAVKNVRYTYSPDGERYERIEDGETTRHLVDSNREHAVVIAELVNGIVRVRLVRPPAGEAAIAMILDGQTSTIYTTPMGTTKLVCNATGIITDSFVLDPFGVVLARTGTTVGLPIYNGEFRDAITGYDYLRARFYAPQKGRFVSMDTFSGWQDVPISLNKYVYAHSDPANGRDPSGHSSLTELQAVFSINTLVFSAAGGIVGYQLGGFKGAVLGALLGGTIGAAAVARTYQFVTAAADSAEISFVSSQFLVPLFLLDAGVVSLGALSFLGASVLGTGLDAKATIDARLNAAGGSSGANLPFSSLSYGKK